MNVTTADPITDKTINILVFPAGTESAFEIHDALQYTKWIRLFGGTGAEHQADCIFKNLIDGLPGPDDPEFVSRLNRSIDEYGISYIFPADNSTLRRLSEERELLHAAVLTSPAGTVGICLSKNRTYAALAGASYIPETWPDAAAVPDDAYPVFVRPSEKTGKGSGAGPGAGAQKIRDRVHLEEILASGTEYAVCEYLPGAEFTVDCFTDQQGVLEVIRPRTRERIRAGIAVRSRALPPDGRITAVAEDLNRRLHFKGAWFFQLKCDFKGAYKLLQIVPRIAGSMGVTRSLGINLPLLTVCAFTGTDMEPLDNGNQILMDRAFVSRFRTDIVYDNVYVDFDDTLVLKGKVNAYLMRFLYQARNQGKKIYLLTRHATDIHTDLAAYRIPEYLFTEIVQMDRKENKGTFIRQNSIFIDDSFAERKRVRQESGVPVFDLDMVESLIDWKT